MIHTKSGEFNGFQNKIPLSGGIEWRVLFAGFMAGSSRSIIECPFEYAKVKR